MTDIDRILDAIYANPYEKLPRRQRTCEDCGEGIFKGDDYYCIDGITYCQRCIRQSKVLG